MNATTILRTRVEPRRKRAAEAVFSKLGLSAGQAINLFYAQVVLRQELPFAVSLRPQLDLANATLAEIEARYAERTPNPESRAALREDLRKAKRHSNSRSLLADLQA
jgi:addiction module RelB/DinJ family antitoxin